jgi:single-strand DNA-binding protein
MTNLNSVLLEGSLVDQPLANTNPDGSKTSIFVLESHRLFTSQTKDSQTTETYHINVETVPGHVTEACLEFLKAGRGVRIVGRLRQHQETKQIYIIAEHVEFKHH